MADIQLSGLLERYSEIGVEFWLDDQDRTVAYTLENSRKLVQTPVTVQAGQPVVHPRVQPSTFEPAASGDLAGWTTYQNQNFVTELAVTMDGIIWAGGPEGIMRYDPNSDSATVFTTLDGLPSAAITSIAVAGDGSVWFGTASSGALQFDGVSWLAYTKDQGLASNSIMDVASAPDGTTWLATQDEGIIHVDGARRPRTGFEHGASDNRHQTQSHEKLYFCTSPFSNHSRGASAVECLSARPPETGADSRGLNRTRQYWPDAARRFR